MGSSAKPLQQQTFNEIQEHLPKLTSKVKGLRETILANLILLGEVPAPTFNEERRNQIFVNRLSEVGLLNTSLDEKNNGFGILTGEEGNEDILVLAHTDTIFSEKTDHTLTIKPDIVTGPGVADNTLGLATIASLPDILKVLDIKLKHNLVLMGSAQSLGRGDIEGLRFFLDNNERPIKAGLCVEGVQLGRLSHKSIGMLRGEVVCRIPTDYDWTSFGDASAILTLNEVINKINDIPLPKRPRSSIVLGKIEGGADFNKRATKAKLGFEIRSESAEAVEDIRFRLEEAVAEVASKTGDHINLDIFAKRQPGGIEFSNPLVRCTRQILKSLEINPRYEPSTSELSGFIDYKIPALTLGISSGKYLQMDEEYIDIEPMFKGIAQLVSIILAIDGGYCDEH
jgi:acetylornithine deacetylase/succinyl-diaminopimelate desuccinylase-like protein